MNITNFENLLYTAREIKQYLDQAKECASKNELNEAIQNLNLDEIVGRISILESSLAQVVATLNSLEESIAQLIPTPEIPEEPAQEESEEGEQSPEELESSELEE